MLSTFLPVYAALRLTGPRRPSLLGTLTRGLVLLAVSPFILFGLTIWLLAQLVSHRRRLTAAQATLRRNVAAYEARQAAQPKSHFARHVAELRRIQGED